MLADQGTGVSTYARALIQAVSQIGAPSYVLTANHTDENKVARWLGAVGRAPRPVSGPEASVSFQMVGKDIFRRAHIHFNIYRRLLPIKSHIVCGIMHWSYPVPLFMEGWINLYTVHDAIPLTRPDLTPINAVRHRAVMRAIVARAHGLITVSDDARVEIIKALGCDPALVTNCSEAVEVVAEGSSAAQFGLVDKGYLLFCGSMEPRKNLAALLAAYRASGVSIPLVLVGPDGWRAGPILKRSDITPGVVRLPYVSRKDLLGLIEGARGLVLPSLAEGFGLPVIEAMSLGTAVLTSDRGALAEVAANAAILVNPNDIAAIAAGLFRLATDDAENERLALLGRARAREFSLAVFAARLREAYNAAIAKHESAVYQRGS